MGDWIESNGNCGGATTLHTKQGNGPDGCTAWGCRASYHYNGKSSFHVRIEYGKDGSWTTIRDGQVINAAACRLRQVASIGESSNRPTRARVLSFIRRNGRAGYQLRIVAPLATFQALTFPSAT